MRAANYLEVKKGRIEIIPMIDIMFFLLVFFMMITLHMVPSQGVSSNLPKSSTEEALKHPKVVINIHSDGAIKVADEVMTMDQLSAYLKQQKDPAHTIVTIAGSAKTSLQNLMHVMDACRSAGISQIGIATSPQS